MKIQVQETFVACSRRSEIIKGDHPGRKLALPAAAEEREEVNRANSGKP